MIIEEALRAFLVADGGVSALVSTRVYPITGLGPEVVSPFVTMTRVGTESPADSFDGAGDMERATLAVDCHSEASISEATDVAEAVEDALEGFSSPGTMGTMTVRGVTKTDRSYAFEDESQTHTWTLEFDLLYTKE